MQTDAPINPGNSGGPLVDTTGRVVGINTFIVTRSGGSQGLGFAVPSNIVRAVFDQIRQTGRVRRGSIGISAQTITPALAAGRQLERLTGVVVGDVYPSGPGEAAGLQPGDVILTLDGKSMENGQSDKVLFEIIDNGIGISPMDLPRLFEKFYRGAQQSSKDQRGTGLGLAIVRSIAERHGGKVWADSKLGKGSIFFLQIPLSQQSAENKSS